MLANASRRPPRQPCSVLGLKPDNMCRGHAAMCMGDSLCALANIMRGKGSQAARFLPPGSDDARRCELPPGEFLTVPRAPLCC